jgi:hypothetical protein
LTTDTNLYRRRSGSSSTNASWLNGILVYTPHLTSEQSKALSLWTVNLNSYSTHSPNRIAGIYASTGGSGGGSASQPVIRALVYNPNSNTDFLSATNTAILETHPIDWKAPFNKKDLLSLYLKYQGQANGVVVKYAIDAPYISFHTPTWTTLTTFTDTDIKLHVRHIPLPAKSCKTLRIRLEFTHSDPRDFVLLGLGVTADVLDSEDS